MEITVLLPSTMHLIKLFVALLLSTYAVSQTPDVTINLETDNSDEITTPNYPDDYGSYVNKLWKITAPVGYRIRLHFTDFNTEDGYDFVIIYDGLSGETREREKFSGDAVPPNVTSINTYMWIRFRSDHGVQSRGFRAIVDAVLIHVLTLTHQTYILTSPNHPDDYDNNVDIMWQVISPPGFRVMVQFTDFKLSIGDFLTLYHGLTDSLLDTTQRADFSGSSLPESIASIGSYMWLRFRSDGSTTRDGFSSSLYPVTPDWACAFQNDTCGLPGTWSVGRELNFHYIQADGNSGDVSSFTIPHAFTSTNGTLSFAHYQRYAGSLSVAVCKSQLPRSYDTTHPYVVYDYIPYSCSGIQDVEITFTATKRYWNTLIRVLDIQLFETSAPSTAVLSTSNSASEQPASITTHGPMAESVSVPETKPSESPSSTRTTMSVTAQASRGFLNSAVIPTVSSVFVLLVVGLVILALFVYRRRRSRVPKTAGPVDQDDDDPTLYNNPVYGSKGDDDSTPDLLVGMGDITSPNACNDPTKRDPPAHHNSCSPATPKKETSNLPPYYSVHYPSKRDVNKEARSKDYEDEDYSYENARGQQSYKDPKKVSTGTPETNEASKTLSSITSHGRGKPDTEQDSGKKGPPDNTAVLADDEEYNALTFNQSADITRALKKPKAGGVNVANGYGVLDLPEDKSSTLQPNSQELHNDDVYSSIDEPPQEHHCGKQEIKGPRTNPKPSKTNKPDSESEYHNYQDPNQMDQDRPNLRESQEPDAISDDQYDILQSGKQPGDQHVYQQTDDAEVGQGYYVNLGANVGNEDEYSTIDKGPSHKLGESEAHGFEPIYSDEVYSEFN